jgi:hypothetical protein
MRLITNKLRCFFDTYSSFSSVIVVALGGNIPLQQLSATLVFPSSNSTTQYPNGKLNGCTTNGCPEGATITWTSTGGYNSVWTKTNHAVVANVNV